MTEVEKFEELEVKFLIPHQYCDPGVVRINILNMKRCAGFKLVSLCVGTFKDWYFDTSDALLLKNRLSLRIRQQEWPHEQTLTLKTSLSKLESGGMRRTEWNRKLSQDEVNGILNSAVPIQKFLRSEFSWHDQVFHTICTFHTNSIQLTFQRPNGEKIFLYIQKLTFDSGTNFKHSWNIEIENKTAKQSTFFRFVREFEKRFPVLPFSLTKYEQGRSLLFHESHPEEFDLKQGVKELVRKIRVLKRIKSGPFIIGIAGGSGSGKTSQVAQKLQKAFPDSKILSCDDYYRGKTFMQSINLDNFDDPRAVNLDLIASHLEELKQGNPINKPVYKFQWEPEPYTECFESAPLIVVEGIFALYPQIVPHLDLAVFVETGVWGRMVRRLVRDALRGRTRQSLLEALRMLLYKVLPSHEQFIEPQKTNANIIIYNEYNPEKEAVTIREFDTQLKIPGVLSQEVLENLKAQFQESVHQHDEYYSPKKGGRRSRELLRIRIQQKDGTQDSTIILTYKGPRLKQAALQKPRFDIVITQQERELLAQYFKLSATITKKREIFTIGGVAVHIDTVEGLGSFVEFCTQTKGGLDAIVKTLNDLGIDSSSALSESYLDMMLKTNKIG